MTNQQILQQLSSERDIVFKRLSAKPLSGFFADEYNSLLSGETFQMGDDKDEALNNLKKHQHDKTQDIAFTEKVNSVNTLSESEIIDGFSQSWKLAFNTVSDNDLRTPMYAALLNYDAYDLPAQNSLTFFGNTEFPELSLPQYLPPSLYETKVISLENVFDFSPAWPDCEEFDWTTEFIEVYFELQTLFKLHSRILLHKALARMDENGSLASLQQRPFQFYIAEHDMEAGMLYTLK